MGLFSGIASAISNVCSSACSAVSKAFSTISKVFRDVTEATFDSFKHIVEAVGKFLGLIPEEADVEETGNKVLQAKENGIIRENFDSFDEYKKALDEFDVDPEKTKKFSKREKEAAGIGFITLGMAERFGDDIVPLMTTVGRTPYLYNTSKVMSYINTFKATGISMDKIDEFYNNSLKKSEIKDVKEAILKSEMDSGVDIETARKNIDDQKL